MVTAQRGARCELEADQAERWQKEEQTRNARIRAGFKGLWDKLNGRYWKTRKRNEQETWKAHLRDQKERENLIQAQLAERQVLQARMNEMRTRHTLERQELMRDMSHIKPHEKQSIHMDERDQDIDHGFDALNLDDDLEPEI
jgi:hypothetical protein